MAIRLQTFAGLDNKHVPDKLFRIERGSAETYLTAAVNVDCLESGGVARRQGFTLLDAGEYHSVWSGGGVHLAVKDGDLGTLDPLTFFHTSLLTVGDNALSYAMLNGVVYFSDGFQIGKVESGAASFLASSGTYDRTPQYLDPTEEAAFFDSPPPGAVLEAFAGRLWSAAFDAVWYSQPFYPERVDRRYNYFPFQGATMLKGTTDGLFVGLEEETWFLSGLDPKQMQAVKVADCGPVPGTPLTVRADDFKIDGAYGTAAIWETQFGKALGLSGGRIVWLTDERAVYNVGEHGASLLREANGQVHHISSLRQPLDGSNMRTTDIAVAEVRRNGIII